LAAHKVKKAVTPRYHSPMLATLVKEPFSDPEWIFERKFDGERCVVVKKGDAVTIYSRSRKKLNDFYPELVASFEKQRKDFVVDGEIVAKTFSDLQTRMQSRSEGKKVPVMLHLFDALTVDGEDVRMLGTLDRKKALKRCISFGGKLRYVTHVKGKGIEAFERAEKRKWEGVIAKRADARYVSKRSRDWLKFKCEKRAQFYIAGFTAPKGSRVGIGALILGVKKRGELVFAGKVGTGFDTKLLQSLAKKLKRIERQKSPFDSGTVRGVHFVTPRYRCEVAFTEWTNDGKLRHPRFVRLVNGKG